MLPRKKLIPLKSEFGRIRKEGKMYDSPSFGLLVSFSGTRDKGLGTSVQVAFIISKKIDKRSVVRHEVKRKLSDAVAPLLPRLAKKVELVFLAKQTAISSSRENLTLEMETLLKRAKLL